jgi:hypothetical protein
MSAPTISRVIAQGTYLTNAQVREVIREACSTSEYQGKKVLLIVPDATRTCPLGMLFKAIFEQIGAGAAAFDVMCSARISR